VGAGRHVRQRGLHPEEAVPPRLAHRRNDALRRRRPRLAHPLGEQRLAHDGLAHPGDDLLTGLRLPQGPAGQVRQVHQRAGLLQGRAHDEPREPAQEDGAEHGGALRRRRGQTPHAPRLRAARAATSP